MKPNPNIVSWSGGLLIAAGVVLGLILSAYATWGEGEAILYTSYHGDLNLRVQCPHMLAPDEAGVIQAKIINITNEEVTPLVSAQISHGFEPRELDQKVTLAALGSRILEWTVEPSDRVFGRLILVNVLQLKYRDNPSRLGSCGILLFSLFGMRGAETFGLLIGISLGVMLLGALLWKSVHPELDEFLVNLVRASTLLMVVTTIALLSTLPRWWGLTLIMDMAIILVTGVLFTDFVLFPKKQTR